MLRKFYYAQNNASIFYSGLSVISCTICHGILGIGTTEEIFQLEGGRQDLMEEFKQLCY